MSSKDFKNKVWPAGIILFSAVIFVFTALFTLRHFPTDLEAERVIKEIAVAYSNPDSLCMGNDDLPDWDYEENKDWVQTKKNEIKEWRNKQLRYFTHLILIAFTSFAAMALVFLWRHSIRQIQKNKLFHIPKEPTKKLDFGMLWLATAMLTWACAHFLGILLLQQDHTESDESLVAILNQIISTINDGCFLLTIATFHYTIYPDWYEKKVFIWWRKPKNIWLVVLGVSILAITLWLVIPELKFYELPYFNIPVVALSTITSILLYLYLVKAFNDRLLGDRWMGGLVFITLLLALMGQFQWAPVSFLQEIPLVNDLFREFGIPKLVSTYSKLLNNIIWTTWLIFIFFTLAYSWINFIQYERLQIINGKLKTAVNDHKKANNALGIAITDQEKTNAELSIAIEDLVIANGVIEKNIKQKELIRRQMNHAIKGSLSHLVFDIRQYVSKFTLPGNENPQTIKNAVAEVESRVAHIYKLHNLLNDQKNFKSDKLSIQLKEYLEDVCKTLHESYQVPERNFSTQINLPEDLKVNPKHARDLGSVILEACLNSFGAYRSKQIANDQQRISIQVEQEILHDKTSLTFSIADHAGGFEEKSIPKTHKGFGIEYLKRIKDSYSGELSFTSVNSGTLVKMLIPVHNIFKNHEKESFNPR